MRPGCRDREDIGRAPILVCADLERALAARMLRPDPAVPIERPLTLEEVLDELRVRLTLVALRAQEDGEVARARGPSATGLGVPTLLSVDCVRRRFAPHQLRHAHAVEMAHEGVPLTVIAPMIAVSAPLRL